MTDCACRKWLPPQNKATRSSREKKVEFFIRFVFGVIRFCKYKTNGALFHAFLPFSLNSLILFGGYIAFAYFCYFLIDYLLIMIKCVRCMFVRLLGCCLLVCMGLPVWAQEKDSLRIRPDSLPLVPQTGSVHLAAPRRDLPGVSRVTMPVPALREVMPQGPYIPYQLNPSPLFRGDYATGGVLGYMGGGAWVGSGSQFSVPGIGRFNTASLGWQKQFSDRLQLQLMADALKMNTAHFTGQSFGLSGQLIYQAADRLYFRTFGGVGLGDFRMRPTYGFGGAVGLGVTERFGIELGAQSYYNTLTGRWEVLPVVAPYYKFDKMKLQIDVGPILLEVIRGAIQKSRGESSRPGPTIMPDVPGFRH